MITYKEIKEQYERTKDALVEVFDKEGYSPMLIFLTYKVGPIYKTTPLAIPETAVDRRFDLVKELGRSLNGIIDQVFGAEVLCIISASEAWVSEVSKKKAEKLGEHNLPRPSQDPNRKEVFMVSAMTRSGETEFDLYDIVSSNGKRILNKAPKEKSWDEIKNNLLQEFWKGHLGIN